MTEQTVQARYQVRRLNYSDTDFLMRGQDACRYELDQMTRDEIGHGLLSHQLEGFILIGPNVRMGLCVQRDGSHALIALFYREGPVTGLWSEAQALWRKTEEHLQAQGVTHVTCFVHRDNPLRDKLLRFYHRFHFTPEMVKLGRSI